MQDIENIYNTRDYTVSRGAYNLQCLFEYFIALMMTDTFLAKLLKNIGLSEAQIGVVSSIISLAFLFQLVSLTFADKIRSVKKVSITIDSISQLLFMSMFLIPLLPVSKDVKTVIAPVVLLCGYFCLYIINSICYRWGNFYVDPRKRASFSAGKEMLSLTGGVLFTFLMGVIVDKYEANDNLHGAFIFIACCMLVVSIGNFICLMMIKDIKITELPEKKSLRDIYNNTLGIKRFRYFVILGIFDGVSVYLINPFMGVFKNESLGMSMKTSQLINTAACFARFVLSKPIGKYSDRKSFSSGHTMGLIIFAVGLAFNIFSGNHSAWCVIIYTILYHASLAGTSANLLNMTYSYVDKDYFVHGMAICNAIKGVLGFGASVFGGKIIDAIQENNNTVFGVHIYGQQLLSLISLIVVIGGILFNAFVVSKQKADIK